MDEKKIKLKVMNNLPKELYEVDEIHLNYWLPEIEKSIEEAIEETKQQMNKEFMLQQLLGFRLGKQGYSVTELIKGAGLTKEEWFSIKDETDVTSLEDSDMDEIEEFVNNLQKLKEQKNG